MMTTDLRRLLAVLTLLASLVLGACGGDGGGDTVTGDSPQGVPVDSALEDEVTDGEQEVPDGTTGEEFDADENLTDGQ